MGIRVTANLDSLERNVKKLHNSIAPAHFFDMLLLTFLKETDRQETTYSHF